MAALAEKFSECLNSTEINGSSTLSISPDDCPTWKKEAAVITDTMVISEIEKCKCLESKA